MNRFPAIETLADNTLAGIIDSIREKRRNIGELSRADNERLLAYEREARRRERVRRQKGGMA